MGAAQNHHIGIESRHVVVGGATVTKYLVSAAVGSGDAPSHAWADFTPAYDTIEALLAAGWDEKWAAFMRLLADTDVSGDPGRNLMMAHLIYLFGQDAWDGISALGEGPGLEVLGLLKARADAGLVTL